MTFCDLRVKICFAMVLRIMNSESCSNSLRLGPFVSRRPVATEQCHGAQRRLVPGVPFLPCETFQATFNSRWPPEAPGIAAIAAGGSKTSVFSPPLLQLVDVALFKPKCINPGSPKTIPFNGFSKKIIFFGRDLYTINTSSKLLFLMVNLTSRGSIGQFFR